MKKIMVVIGTRPEAIKLGPVVEALKKREDALTSVVSTGQHRELLQTALKAFSIVPDVSLEPSGRSLSLAESNARIVSGMAAVLQRQRPDLLLVQGDTVSAYASAMAAFYGRIPVGHVEAGLRTYRTDAPFPEELYRTTITRLATYHFAPTLQAKRNLLREGVSERHVWLTGNTVIDALSMSLRGDLRSFASFTRPKGRLLLFTAHRREHTPGELRGMMRALKRLVTAFEDVSAVCPLHPDPRVRGLAGELLEGDPRIKLIDPPDFVTFHRLLAASHLVLTDSGGIQEEATALGIPTLVMRYTSERTEGIGAGVLRLAGSREDSIFDLASRLLQPDSEEYAAMRRPSRVFGDGRASARICNALLKYS